MSLTSVTTSETRCKRNPLDRNDQKWVWMISGNTAIPTKNKVCEYCGSVRDPVFVRGPPWLEPICRLEAQETSQPIGRCAGFPWFPMVSVLSWGLAPNHRHKRPSKNLSIENFGFGDARVVMVVLLWFLPSFSGSSRSWKFETKTGGQQISWPNRSWRLHRYLMTVVRDDILWKPDDRWDPWILSNRSTLNTSSVLEPMPFIVSIFLNPMLIWRKFLQPISIS
jgi:hypothetical protein